MNRDVDFTVFGMPKVDFGLGGDRTKATKTGINFLMEVGYNIAISCKITPLFSTFVSWLLCHGGPDVHQKFSLQN